MPKEVPQIATDAVKPAINMSIIYIAIIICIVIVGSYFMYMVLVAEFLKLRRLPNQRKTNQQKDFEVCQSLKIL